MNNDHLDNQIASFSLKEIAQRMVITVGTVKRHTGNIYQKFNVHTRMAAATRARSLKLLE